MIVPMTRVRILGTRASLPDVIRALQDTGVLHVVPQPGLPELTAFHLPPSETRRRRQLLRILGDADAVLAGVGEADGRVPPPPVPSTSDCARWARLAGRTRRRLASLDSKAQSLEEERALLARYHGVFEVLERLLRTRPPTSAATAFHVVLRADQTDAVPRLRAALADLIGDAFETVVEPLPSGEIVMLLLVPASAAERVERLLAETRVEEVSAPRGYGNSPIEAGPRMRERERAIPGELEAIRRERAELSRQCRAELTRARSALRDRVAQLDALSFAGVTPHAFVLEGWLPAAAEGRLASAIEARFGGDVVVEAVGREHWRGEEAPVVLHNPRLFRPFEVVTRMLPLPRYGTIDPTPYVGVFFPMFFGLMLGDAGYGGVLALLALVLHRRSRPGTTLRAVAEIGGPCALFAIVFGVLFGEYFGDLGHTWFHLRPVWFDRGEAIVPFLGLTVALGAVHILLGLILGAVTSARRHPREAAGRGLSAVMLLLVIAAILAALDLLPRGLLTPAVILLFAAFPVLIVLEGIVAPVELLSTMGHVLSYARIMALGTASVMLAVVANRMAGAMGSAVIGVLFALLFHFVNFGLGLFTPTIHALRLHYVEFFGTFYSPGGIRYQPLGHWTPPVAHPA
ncbi:MAG TPA: V-type ATPase 116kDa subunit family protein [Gemmatimonadales bacterium]|nr:V-type ATPase 116kDa subunit family protein [Gemmatimonadales bacterium]